MLGIGPILPDIAALWTGLKIAALVRVDIAVSFRRQSRRSERRISAVLHRDLRGREVVVGQVFPAHLKIMHDIPPLSVGTSGFYYQVHTQAPGAGAPASSRILTIIRNLRIDHGGDEWRD